MTHSGGNPDAWPAGDSTARGDTGDPRSWFRPSEDRHHTQAHYQDPYGDELSPQTPLGDGVTGGDQGTPDAPGNSAHGGHGPAWDVPPGEPLGMAEPYPDALGGPTLGGPTLGGPGLDDPTLGGASLGSPSVEDPSLGAPAAGDTGSFGMTSEGSPDSLSPPWTPSPPTSPGYPDTSSVPLATPAAPVTPAAPMPAVGVGETPHWGQGHYPPNGDPATAGWPPSWQDSSDGSTVASTTDSGTPRDTGEYRYPTSDPLNSADTYRATSNPFASDPQTSTAGYTNDTVAAWGTAEPESDTPVASPPDTAYTPDAAAYTTDAAGVVPPGNPGDPGASAANSGNTWAFTRNSVRYDSPNSAESAPAGSEPESAWNPSVGTDSTLGAMDQTAGAAAASRATQAWEPDPTGNPGPDSQPFQSTTAENRWEEYGAGSVGSTGFGDGSASSWTNGSAAASGTPWTTGDPDGSLGSRTSYASPSPYPGGGSSTGDWATPPWVASDPLAPRVPDELSPETPWGTTSNGAPSPPAQDDPLGNPAGTWGGGSPLDAEPQRSEQDWRTAQSPDPGLDPDPDLEIGPSTQAFSVVEDFTEEDDDELDPTLDRGDEGDYDERGVSRGLRARMAKNPIASDFPDFDEAQGGDIVYPGYDNIAYLPETAGGAKGVLALGISSVLLFPLGIVLGGIGLLLAPKARRAIRESGGELEGNGMIAVGSVLSCVGIGLFLVAIVVGALVVLF